MNSGLPYPDASGHLFRHGPFFRFVAHVLIRLLILTPLPREMQAALLLYPVSVLWLLDEKKAPAEDAGGAGEGLGVRVFPDASGIVHLTAPAGTLPPGATVLVINAGNGQVGSFTAENDGAVGVLVPAELPASISDLSSRSSET